MESHVEVDAWVSSDFLGSHSQWCVLSWERSPILDPQTLLIQPVYASSIYLPQLWIFFIVISWVEVIKNEFSKVAAIFSGISGRSWAQMSGVQWVKAKNGL